MHHLFITDFVKNRSIQCIAFIGAVCDLLIAHSLNHIIVLLGFPYLTSIVLHILIPQPITVKRRISEQYRPIAKNSSQLLNDSQPNRAEINNL